MLVFKRFHHVVVGVRDVKTAAVDWQRLFGGPAMQPRERPGPANDWTSVRFPVGGAWIELAQPLTEGSPLGRFLEAYGQGVYSVGVQVNDVAALAGRALRMGAQVLGDEDRPGEVYIDPKSTNGVLLGLHAEGARAEGRSMFRRFHHIVVAVRDHKAAAANWEKLFGTRPHPEGPDRVIVPSHIPVGNAWFGLTAEGTDAPAVSRFLERRGEGVYLLSLVVDDVKKSAAAIRERGGRVIGDENRPGQVFVHPATTHGVLVELSDDAVRMWPDEA